MLSRRSARAFYDAFGERQDEQGWYEDAPVARLRRHADLPEARRVLELGCGTGRLAVELLTGELPASCRYLGLDLSTTMAQIARRRLAPFGTRAAVAIADGQGPWPVATGSVDRVVACYAFDIFPREAIRAALAEAHRVLVAGGRLCVVGLTPGPGPVSRLVSALWSALARLRPRWVGGCRPVEVAELLDPESWRTLHRSKKVSAAIPSEVLVAVKPAATRSGEESPCPESP